MTFNLLVLEGGYERAAVQGARLPGRDEGRDHGDAPPGRRPRVRPQRPGEVRRAGAAPRHARPPAGGQGHPHLAAQPLPGHVRLHSYCLHSLCGCSVCVQVCECDGAVQADVQGGRGRAEGAGRLHQVRGHRPARGAERGGAGPPARQGPRAVEAGGHGAAL